MRYPRPLLPGPGGRVRRPFDRGTRGLLSTEERAAPLPARRPALPSTEGGVHPPGGPGEGRRGRAPPPAPPPPPSSPRGAGDRTVASGSFTAGEDGGDFGPGRRRRPPGHAASPRAAGRAMDLIQFDESQSLSRARRELSRKLLFRPTSAAAGSRFEDRRAFLTEAAVKFSTIDRFRGLPGPSGGPSRAPPAKGVRWSHFPGRSGTSIFMVEKNVEGLCPTYLAWSVGGLFPPQSFPAKICLSHHRRRVTRQPVCQSQNSSVVQPPSRRARLRPPASTHCLSGLSAARLPPL
ncbi:hypothetical protein THAOC_27156 [Thalassiosira oceanica]|uniref:Uncharacterized protein n=1 Tax=Thalassiosira oceanica TaxID=159749 RepID=K0S3D1_THAOC|nr:hypothetical protein THAOC_27156 [Thalassiosira oceanica]|eukprot:EJK53417.1 hypothetical protein THAOC_27156 [Thalassiosira oceanica]